MKRTVAAFAVALALAGCGQPAAQQPVEQPANQVDVDAVGEDPTSQPCDATTHLEHIPSEHIQGRHVCPTEHGGH
jgi:PBP1b-binding outer membrane lipoprotein LpoB